MSPPGTGGGATIAPSKARLRVISRASLLRFFDGASGTSEAMTFIVRVAVDEAGGVTGSAPPSRKIADEEDEDDRDQDPS